MAREYTHSSRAVEKAFGRTGLGKLRGVWGIKKLWPTAEADRKIKEVKDSRTKLWNVVRQLNLPHVPSQRNSLIQRLRDAAADYTQDVEELRKTHAEAVTDVKGFVKELDTEDEYSGKGEIERIRKKNREIAVTLGWGSMENKIQEMESTLTQNTELQQKLKGYVKSGGIRRIADIQEKINETAATESGHAYSQHEKIALEAAAESHDNRRDIQAELSSHHSDLAQEVRKLGVALGVVKEE